MLVPVLEGACLTTGGAWEGLVPLHVARGTPHWLLHPPQNLPVQETATCTCTMIMRSDNTDNYNNSSNNNTNDLQVFQVVARYLLGMS